MTSSGDWFGTFKADLADHFGRDAVTQMSTYFDLPPKKRDQVEESKNRGLELLSVLEDREIIGKQKGINELCEALRDCNLNRIAREAETSFNNLQKDTSPDSPDLGSVPQDIDIPKLKKCLRDELTAQDCYEIAMTLGLPAKNLEEIRDSRDSARLMIDKLHDRGQINRSNIRALLFALEKRSLKRVANLIRNSGNLETHGPETRSELSATEEESSKCICGYDSFEELKLESANELKTISLQCNNCSAEWFQTTSTSGGTTSSEPGRDLSLSWNNGSFSYKIPHELNLSELQNEDVSDIKDLQRGDQIIFRRKDTYDHHAIFLGIGSDGKMDLIEWTGTFAGFFKKLVSSKSDVGIQRTRKPFPPQGVKRRVYKHSDPVDVVIARAFNVMKKSENNYDLFENNCESFATFCKVGKSISIQGKVLEDTLPPAVAKLAKLSSGFVSR